MAGALPQDRGRDRMQGGAFTGRDVRKATIPAAGAQGKRGGEVRHSGTVPHRPDHVRKPVEKLAERGCMSALKPVPAATGCIASLSGWGTIASWWPPRSSR